MRPGRRRARAALRCGGLRGRSPPAATKGDSLRRATLSSRGRAQWLPSRFLHGRTWCCTTRVVLPSVLPARARRPSAMSESGASKRGPKRKWEEAQAGQTAGQTPGEGRETRSRTREAGEALREAAAQEEREEERAAAERERAAAEFAAASAAAAAALRDAPEPVTAPDLRRDPVAAADAALAAAEAAAVAVTAALGVARAAAAQARQEAARLADAEAGACGCPRSRAQP